MSRIHLFTSVFCSAETFRLGMARLQRSAPNLAALGVTHTLWDQHYPKDRAEVQRAICEYAENAPYRVEVRSAGRDVGLVEAFNALIAAAAPEPTDVVIGVDADTDIERAGWVEAMARVHAADPSCGWLSLAVKDVKKHQLATHPQQQIGGEAVYRLECPLQFDVCSWTGKSLRDVGEWTGGPYYGGLEVCMWNRFTHKGYWVGIMADYEVQGRVEGVDPSYLNWKRHHASHILPHFPGSYAEWLETGHE